MSRTREWARLKYFSPRKVLLNLNKIAAEYPLESYSEPVRNLRTHDLRQYGESRQCAIFCYGMGEVLGLDISYANFEASDFDFVATYLLDGERAFVPIQMKEFVPEDRNPKSDLEAEMQKLAKYADAVDLCVAIHLNRQGTINFETLNIPSLNIRELWLFGATSPDLDRWILVGNMLREYRVHEFRYPRA